jgi:hypothetical protein
MRQFSGSRGWLSFVPPNRSAPVSLNASGFKANG